MGTIIQLQPKLSHLKAVVANIIAKPYKLLCFYQSSEKLQKEAEDSVL